MATRRKNLTPVARRKISLFPFVFNDFLTTVALAEVVRAVFSGGGATSRGWTPARGDPPFDVPPLARMLLQTTPRDVKGAPQHEPEVLLRAVTRHGDLFAPDFDVDANTKVVAALVVTMGNVGDNVAGNDSGTDCIELASALADFSFDERIGFLAGERDRNRLPHA